MNTHVPAGAFVGLTTLDFIYLLEAPLGVNQKDQALSYLAAAGGPAANAAVAFAALGGAATLFSGFGENKFSDIALHDLAAYAVEIVECGSADAMFPVSSVLVQQATADRAVISINDRDAQGEGPRLHSPQILESCDVVVLDGFYPQLALNAAVVAKEFGIPLLLDGDTWNSSTREILSFVDVVVCSSDFHPEGSVEGDVEGTLDLLLSLGPELAAISNGGEPIQWKTRSSRGSASVNKSDVIDTLAAGDILHGGVAFAMAMAKLEGRTELTLGVTEMLEFGSEVASYSCQSFGSRNWIKDWQSTVRHG